MSISIIARIVGDIEDNSGVACTLVFTSLTTATWGSLVILVRSGIFNPEKLRSARHASVVFTELEEALLPAASAIATIDSRMILFWPFRKIKCEARRTIYSSICLENEPNASADGHNSFRIAGGNTISSSDDCGTDLLDDLTFPLGINTNNLL